MEIRLALVVLVLASTSAFAADRENFHQAPASALELRNPNKKGNSAAVKAGAALFAQNCASCHGKDAGGTGNIPALSHGDAQAATDGEVYWFIRTGSVDNGMPASNLPEPKLWQVVTFIKSLPNAPHSATPAALPTMSVEAARDTSPQPRAPFTDYRYEMPGQVHHILARDIPPPAPRTAVTNGPDVVERPANAWPKVPAGFKVQVFAAKLDNPRLMRTAPNGDVFLAESDPGKILVFRGTAEDGKAKQTETFVSGLDHPYGIAFYPAGNDPKWIYFGNTNEIVRVPYKVGDLRATAKPEKITDLPGGRGHWTRDLQFSADGKRLLVAVGSASNVDDPDTNAGEKDRADILSMNPDGTDRQIYAYGVRNAGGGLAIHPTTGELWASVNERDGLGDDLVPDYITHIQEHGFYGWPWWYIGGHQDPRHEGKHPELKEKLITPDVLLQPHHASLEMAFYGGANFPKEYLGDIFSAQHGSWNRSVRTGYEVIRVPLHQKSQASGEYEDFMTGFVVDGGHVWGRPVGVTVASDGSLLVSDDGSNTVWRVVYSK